MPHPSALVASGETVLSQGPCRIKPCSLSRILPLRVMRAVIAAVPLTRRMRVQSEMKNMPIRLHWFRPVRLAPTCRPQHSCPTKRPSHTAALRRSNTQPPRDSPTRAHLDTINTLHRVKHMARDRHPRHSALTDTSRSGLQLLRLDITSPQMLRMNRTHFFIRSDSRDRRLRDGRLWRL